MRRRATELVIALVVVALAASACASEEERRPTLPFGFNTILTSPHWNPDDVGRAAADIQPGALIRFVIQWQQVQPHCAVWDRSRRCAQPGAFDWRTVDRQVARLSAHDVKVLPVVMAAPRWAWRGLDRSAPGVIGQPLMPPGDDPRSLGWWTEFVGALIARIEDRHPDLLAAVEIWNEQNSPVFWTLASGPSPARYARLLCAAHRGVRAVDPDLPVIFGGLGEARPGDLTTMPLDAFLEGAYGAKANGGPDIRSCMSSMGVHPYGYGTRPVDEDGAFLLALETARRATAANGDAGRTLSITEFGYHSDGPLGVERQSEWDIEAYRIAAGVEKVAGMTLAGIDMMVIHTLFDGQGTADDVTASGVCRRPGDPKPAAGQFKQLFTDDVAARC